jgi:hypothetical protein
MPNSWLGGFKAAAAAVSQVRAEQRHIKQALLQRQGLLPSTKASICGFEGGSKVGQQLLGATAAGASSSSSLTAKDVAGTQAAATGAVGYDHGGKGVSSSRRDLGGSKAAAVDTSSLSTQLLHIPEATLQKLKVIALKAWVAW